MHAARTGSLLNPRVDGVLVGRVPDATAVSAVRSPLFIQDAGLFYGMRTGVARSVLWLPEAALRLAPRFNAGWATHQPPAVSEGRLNRLNRPCGTIPRKIPRVLIAP